MSEHRFIKMNKENGVAIITIENGPMNVLSQEVVRQFGEVCDAIAADPKIIVAILTGGGKRAFVAGADIREFTVTMELTAGQAKEIGLVNQVVPQGEALAAAKKFARNIAQKSLSALALIKEAVDKGSQLSLEE